MTPLKQLDDLSAAFHFGGGICLKEYRLSAGLEVPQHVHAHDHLSYLVSGEATIDGAHSRHAVTGPAAMLIEAGRAHRVTAITDCVWLCIHATACTDAALVDNELIA